MRNAKKRLFELMFVLAFGLLVFFAMQGATARGATIVVDVNGNGDYTTIQDGIDNATEGDTIQVWEGTYEETIAIDKIVTIKGNGTTSTTIDGGGSDDVVTASAHHVNLSGFKIKNSKASGSGIYSEKNYTTFEKLNLTGNYYGIYLKNSKKNTVKNNEVYANTKAGINLDFSNENLITENILKKNEDGIALLFSFGNEIHKNTALDNTDDGIDIDPGSQYNKISNNIASKNDFGIICTGASDNLIVNNTAQYNTYIGIALYLKSKNNTIYNNTATLNTGFGIAVHAANHTLISKSTVSTNGMGGIYLNLSHDNYVTYNNFTFNKGYGIVIENATEHTIRYNTIAENKHGIYAMGDITHTRIYFNNIYNNTGAQTGMANLNTRNSLYAPYNWWGDATGPKHITNSGGKGDNVSGLVEFNPWMNYYLKGFSLGPIEDTLAPHEVKYYAFNMTTDGENLSELFFTIWSSLLKDRENLTAKLYYGVGDYKSAQFGMLPEENWGDDQYSYFNKYTPLIRENLSKNYAGNVQGLVIVENLGTNQLPFVLEHTLMKIKERDYNTTLRFEPGETKYFNVEINGTNKSSQFVALAGWSNETVLEDIFLEFKYLKKDPQEGAWIEEGHFGWFWGEHVKYYAEIFNYTANGTLVVRNLRSYPIFITLKSQVEFKEINNTINSTIAPGMYQYYAFSLENISMDDYRVISAATWLENWTHKENFTVKLYGLNGWWDRGHVEYTGYGEWDSFGWSGYEEFYYMTQDSVDYNSTFYLVLNNTGNHTITYYFNSLYKLIEINNTNCLTLKSNETFFFTFDVYGIMDYPDFIHTSLMMKAGNETRLRATIYYPSEWGLDYSETMGGWDRGMFYETMKADVYKTDKALLILRNDGYGELKLCVNSLHKLMESNNRYNVTLKAREVRYYNLTIDNLSCIAGWQKYANMWNLSLEFKYLYRDEMYGESYWNEKEFGWTEDKMFQMWFFKPYAFMNVEGKNTTKGYLVVRNNNESTMNFTINSVHKLYLQDHVLVDNISAGAVNYYKMLVPYVEGESCLLAASMWLNNLTNETNLTARAFVVGWYYDGEEWEYYLDGEDRYVFGWHYDSMEKVYLYDPMLQDYICSSGGGEEEFFMDYYAVYFVVESWWNKTVNFTLNAPYKIWEIENNTFSAVFAPGETKYYTFSAKKGEENATFVSIAKWLEYGNDMNMSFKLKHWDVKDEEYSTEWFMTGKKASHWVLGNESRFLLVVTSRDKSTSKLWFNSVFKLTEINFTYETVLSPGETIFYNFTLDASENDTELFAVARWVEYGNLYNVSVEIKYWEDGWKWFSMESLMMDYEYEFWELFYNETEFLLVVTNNDYDKTAKVFLRSIFELEELNNTISATFEPGETRYYEFMVDADEYDSGVAAFARWVEAEDMWDLLNFTVEIKLWGDNDTDYYSETMYVENMSHFSKPLQLFNGNITNDTYFLVVITYNGTDSSDLHFNSNFEFEEADNIIDETLGAWETKFYEFEVEPETNMSEMIVLAGWLESVADENITVELKYWEEGDEDYVEEWFWFGDYFEPYQMMVENDTSFLVVVTNDNDMAVNLTLNSLYALSEVANVIGETLDPWETKFYEFDVEVGENMSEMIVLAGWLESEANENLTVELKYWEDGDDYYYEEWFGLMDYFEPYQMMVTNDTNFLVVVTNKNDEAVNLTLNFLYELNEVTNLIDETLAPWETKFYEFDVEVAENMSELMAFAAWLESEAEENITVELKWWEEGDEDHEAEWFEFADYFSPYQMMITNDTKFLVVVTNDNDMSVNLTLNSLFELYEADNLIDETLAPWETKFYEFEVEVDENMSELVVFAGWRESEAEENITIEFKYWEESVEDYEWAGFEFGDYFDPYQMMLTENTSFLVVVTNHENKSINFTLNSLHELYEAGYANVSETLVPLETLYYNFTVEADELNGTVVALGNWLTDGNLTDFEGAIFWYDLYDETGNYMELGYNGSYYEQVAQVFINTTTTFYVVVHNNNNNTGDNVTFELKGPATFNLSYYEDEFYMGAGYSSNYTVNLTEPGFIMIDPGVPRLDDVNYDIFYNTTDLVAENVTGFFADYFNVTGEYLISYHALNATYYNLSSNLELERLYYAPIINTTTPPEEVDEDSDYLYDFNATDVDYGDEFNWSLDTNATWLQINATTGVLNSSRPPTNDEVGWYYVNVTVEDLMKLSSWLEFYLNVTNTNDAPNITTTTPPEYVDEDDDYYYDFEAEDVDFRNDENEELYWDWDTNATSWLGIDHATGNVSGTPLNGDVDVFYVYIYVEDNYGEQDWFYYNITVNNTNDDPVIDLTTPPPDTVNEDSEYNYGFEADDDDLIHGNELLTWSLDTDATWLEINATTGVLNGTPTNDDLGPHLVEVTVEDLEGASNSHQFTITVINTNDPPEIIITFPWEDEELTGSPFTIEGEYGDMDLGDVIEALEVKIDDGEWMDAEFGGEGRATEMSSWSYDWNTAKYLNGPHTIHARVTDDNDATTTTMVNVTTNNLYQDATIDVILDLNETSDILNVTGTIETDDYLPDGQAVKLEIDPAAGQALEPSSRQLFQPVVTVYANATGGFRTEIDVSSLKVGKHILEARATMPSGANVTGNESFIIVNPVKLGEVRYGGGTIYREGRSRADVDREGEFFSGDFIYSGDVFEADSNTVILIYKDNLNVDIGTSDLYLFMTAGTRAGFLLLDDDALLIWFKDGFAAFYIMMESGGGQTLSRAEGDGMIDILLGSDPLIDDVFAGEEYNIIIDIDEITSSTFFSLDIAEDSSSITSYEGMVNVENSEGNEEVVDKYRTIDATPTGDLSSENASYDIVEIDGNVESEIKVNKTDIEDVAGAYHIPGFGGDNIDIALIPEGSEYDVDLGALGGGGDYSVSVSRVRTLEEREYKVRTTATNATEDSYNVNKDGNFSIDSNEAKKTYDIEIVRTKENQTTNFTGEDYEMVDKTQTFSVTDWDNLDNEKEKPVTYGVDGKEYELSTGKTGSDVNEIVAGKEEEKGYGLVIALLLIVIIIGAIVATGVFKRELLEKAVGEKRVEKIFGKKKEPPKLEEPEKPGKEKEAVAEEVEVEAEVEEDVEIEKAPEIIFPKIVSCPGCKSKMKLANPGRFNCYKCEKDLVLEKDGTLCTFEDSTFYCLEKEETEGSEGSEDTVSVSSETPKTVRPADEEAVTETKLTPEGSEGSEEEPKET